MIMNLCCYNKVDRTRRLGTAPNGRNRHVDLPLQISRLNETMFQVGIWLHERRLSAVSRVIFDPEAGIVRIDNLDDGEAASFRRAFDLATACPRHS